MQRCMFEYQVAKKMFIYVEEKKEWESTQFAHAEMTIFELWASCIV